MGQNRTQFSISFFIFALLFLLFDLEILLVYPYVVSAYTNGIYGLVIMLIFFLALTLGFAFELGKNALKIDSRQQEYIFDSGHKNISFISKRGVFTLNKKFFVRVFTVFFFGFILRMLISILSDVNLFKDFLNIFSIFYYGSLALVSAFVFEIFSETANEGEGFISKMTPTNSMGEDDIGKKPDTTGG